MSGVPSEVNAAFAGLENLVAYEKKRFTSQAAFARSLLAEQPEPRKEWEKLIAEAESLVSDAAGRGDGEALGRAVRSAEKILAPVGAVAKDHTIYCVGHAHIDMNWMWSWPETVSVAIDSTTTVLRLMEEYPGFRFSQSQASVYSILETYRPDLLEAVRKRVAEGRWEVTASHWVEGDKNLADGESLCRHLLYTRAYMRELFDLSPEDVPIDWSPDTFGHALTVPSYLVRGGVRYLYLHRPGSAGKRPLAFWWQSPDGSRVLVRNDMLVGYNGVIEPAMIPRSLLSFRRQTGLPFTLFVYGVGDHGGGPTRRDLSRIMDMNGWPIFPKLRFSKALEFYRRLEAEGDRLPVLTEELNFEFTGCYTSQSLIKRINRYAVKRLTEAETVSLIGEAAAGVPRETEKLSAAWRDALFNHFHDILPGSGVHDTRTYSHGLFQQTMAMSAAIATRSYRALAGRVNTAAAGAETAMDGDSIGGSGSSGGTGSQVDASARGADRAIGGGAGMGALEGGLSRYGADTGAAVHPLVIFNMTGRERREVVEAVIWDPGRGDREPEGIRFSVLGPEGRLPEPQLIERGSYWGHSFHRIAFPVTVPGFGHALHMIREAEDAKDLGYPQPATGKDAEASDGARQIGCSNVCAYSAYERSPEGLENEHLRLEVDPETGGVAALVEKSSGARIIGGGGILEYLVERPRTMSAWLIEHSGPPLLPEVVRIERFLQGPHRAALRVHFRIKRSEFRLTYELRAGDPRLHLSLEGTWFERGGKDSGTPALRLALPIRFSAPRVRYEIPFGSVERDLPNGEEAPALRWAHVRDADHPEGPSCVLFNDSKHGHSFRDGCLYLSLIRGSFEPDPLPEIGEHSVKCALGFPPGDVDASELGRMAVEFDQDLQVVSTGVHGGPLPASGSFLELESGPTVLGCLKGSEDGEGVIGRVFNPTAASAEARFRFGSFFGDAAAAVAVDVLERPAADGGSVSLEKGEVVVEVPAFGMATAKIRFD